MSLEALQAIAEHSRARDARRMVALALAFHAQPRTQLSWPSDQRLMQFTRLSKRHVQRALRELEQAGEIHRQSRQPGGPRRVYLVDPRAGVQLSLASVEGATGGTFPEARQGAICDIEGATHARAGRNRKNLNDSPPNPPEGGNGGDLLRTLHDNQRPTSDLGRRRRRRRRAQAPGVATEPCPLLNPAPGAGAPAALDQWAVLERLLWQRLGAGVCEIWFAGAHLHQADERLVLAVNPSTADWIGWRFGRTLAALADRPVALIGCERLAAGGASR